LIKKILILAGTHFQIPVINYAKRKGHFVITCDNRPENPGHSIADKYYKISTTDLDGILEVSKKEGISGILAYGSDVAALTAAYVSDSLELQGNNFNSIETLTNKGLFRKCLKENNYPVPGFAVFSDYSKADEYFRSVNKVAFLKPVDSSGSKGVTKLRPGDDIRNAYNNAMHFSRKKEVIIEEGVLNKGPHIHGEAFYYKGELKFMLLGDQYFSLVNSCAPLSTTLPSVYHCDIMDKIKSCLISLMSLVKFDTGGLNIEIIRDERDNIFFIEVGPRNGGNLMPELAMSATGFNLAAANVNAVMDEAVDFNYSTTGSHYVTQVILHSYKDGKYSGPNIPEKYSKYLTNKLIYYSEGDYVNRYRGSQDVIGLMLFKFNNISLCKELTDYILTNNLVRLID